MDTLRKNKVRQSSLGLSHGGHVTFLMQFPPRDHDQRCESVLQEQRRVIRTGHASQFTFLLADTYKL